MSDPDLSMADDGYCQSIKAVDVQPAAIQRNILYYVIDIEVSRRLST